MEGFWNLRLATGSLVTSLTKSLWCISVWLALWWVLVDPNVFHFTMVAPPLLLITFKVVEMAFIPLPRSRSQYSLMTEVYRELFNTIKCAKKWRDLEYFPNPLYYCCANLYKLNISIYDTRFTLTIYWNLTFTITKHRTCCKKISLLCEMI